MFMQDNGLQRRVPIGAASGRLPGRRACPMLILCVGMVYGAALAAPFAKADAAAKSAITQATTATSGDFVGSEVCATCHQEVSKGFTNNPHRKLALEHRKTSVSCEDCHGAGRAHVAGNGDRTRIFNPANAPGKEVNAKCLGCHQGQHRNFDRSAHAEGNVSCISCHDIHGGKEESLLKAPQPALCYQCHADVKPQFAMPFHHKVDEGLVQCSDCHDPHGTFEKNGLTSVAQQDAVCVKCHTETAGPFVYEHSVVKTEGCTACHTPHGGPNPRLLNRASVDAVCLQCHSASMNFTTMPPSGPSHNQAAQYRSCLICHASIHGSNTSALFFTSTE